MASTRMAVSPARISPAISGDVTSAYPDPSVVSLSASAPSVRGSTVKVTVPRSPVQPIGASMGGSCAEVASRSKTQSGESTPSHADDESAVWLELSR